MALSLSVEYRVGANRFSAHTDFKKSAIGSLERRSEPLEENNLEPPSHEFRPGSFSAYGRIGTKQVYLAGHMESGDSVTR